MGSGTAIVIIILVLVGLYFGSDILGKLGIDTTKSGYSQSELNKLIFDADKLAIKPTATEQLCDLKVTVYGELHGFTAIGLQDDLSPLPANLKILLGKGTAHPNARSYSWINCASSTAVPASLLWDLSLDYKDEKQNNYPDQLALFVVEEHLSAQIVLNSGAFKVDAVSQAGLKKSLIIPQGNIPLPYDMRSTFVVTNIPNRDYDMDIYYGQEINDLPAGVPYSVKICKSGKAC